MVLGDVIDIGEPLRQFIAVVATLSVGAQAQPVQTVNIAAKALPTAGMAGFGDALLQLAPLQASMFAAQALSEAGATSLSALARLDAGVPDADEDDLYAAMDWLLARQDTIQAKLAARHLSAGGLVLYDLSSSYFEGTTCPLVRRGYSRDGKPGTLHSVASWKPSRASRPTRSARPWAGCWARAGCTTFAYRRAGAW